MRNRMKIGMGMQADPTVIYALQKAGKYTGNLQARRSAVRFALQHVSLSPACRRTDRRARQGLARGRGQAGGRGLLVFREQERRVARVRVDARRTQPQRVYLAGGLLSEAATAEIDRRQRRRFESGVSSLAKSVVFRIDDARVSGWSSRTALELCSFPPGRNNSALPAMRLSRRCPARADRCLFPPNRD